MDTILYAARPPERSGRTLTLPQPCGEMIGLQIMPPDHFVNRDTGHQRHGRDTTLVCIRTAPLAKWTDNDLPPANAHHIVLYISSQRRLHSKSTLGNGFADQAAIRTVGSEQQLFINDISERMFIKPRIPVTLKVEKRYEGLNGRLAQVRK